MEMKAPLTVLALLAVLMLPGHELQAQSTPTWPTPNNTWNQPGRTLTQKEVEISATPDRKVVPPGGDLVIAIEFKMAKGWHIWPNKPEVPEALGMPDPDTFATKIKVDQQDNEAVTAHAGYIQWPEMHAVQVNFGTGPISLNVYEGNAIAYLPITIAETAEDGPVELSLLVTYQACDDRKCLLLEQDVPLPAIEFKIGLPTSRSNSANAPNEMFSQFDPSVWTPIHAGIEAPDSVSFKFFGFNFDIAAGGAAGITILLLLALIGGFLLNFTPCVLPVIPIKIMSLSQTSKTRMRTLQLGIFMCLGVFCFWLAMGIAIASVASFDAIGQLFTYPIFTILVGAFIVLMAFGMCGLFSVRLPNFIYSVNPKLDGGLGSFLFGVMTAVLATPCTAPFMGAAAAWAVKQPGLTTLATFSAIGVGMSLPYLFLSAFPQLVERMPKTGPASELIKQIMGLLLLAAASYFIGAGISDLAENSGDPPMIWYWWLIAGFGVAAGVWLIWRTIRITRSPVRLIAFFLIGLASIGIFVLLGITETRKGPINWVYYTHARYDAVRAEQKVVLLDFTADTCINCKVLERTVLEQESVVELLNQADIVAIKVDTAQDEGGELLNEIGGVSIPLLIILNGDGDVVFRSDFYLVDEVVDALNKAQNQTMQESSTTSELLNTTEQRIFSS